MENHLRITCFLRSPASQQQPQSNNLTTPSNGHHFPPDTIILRCFFLPRTHDGTEPAPLFGSPPPKPAEWQTHALAPENSDKTERENASKFRKKSSKIAEIQLKSFAGAGAKRNPDVCGGGNRGQTYYKSPTGTTDLRPILHVQPPPPRHSYTHLPRLGGVHSRPGPARPVPPEHVLPVHAGARFQNLPVTSGSQLSHVARAMPKTGRVQNPGFSNPRRAGFQKHPVIVFTPQARRPALVAPAIHQSTAGRVSRCPF